MVIYGWFPFFRHMFLEADLSQVIKMQKNTSQDLVWANDVISKPHPRHPNLPS